MDSFRGRRSMHTLRKLPTARPRRANKNTKSASTDIYCGHTANRLSILNTSIVNDVVRGFNLVHDPEGSYYVCFSRFGHVTFVLLTAMWGKATIQIEFEE